MLLNQLVKATGATARLAMAITTKATAVISKEVQQAYQEGKVQTIKSTASYNKMSTTVSAQYKSLSDEVNSYDW